VNSEEEAVADAAAEIAHVAVNVLRLRSNYNSETLRQPAKETLSAAFCMHAVFAVKTGVNIVSLVVRK